MRHLVEAEREIPIARFPVGTTEISATSGTVVGMKTLTVTAATLVSIAVTPATASIALLIT